MFINVYKPFNLYDYPNLIIFNSPYFLILNIESYIFIIRILNYLGKYVASSPTHTYEFLVSFEAHVISSKKKYNEKQKKNENI